MKKKIYITPSTHIQEGRLASIIQASNDSGITISTPYKVQSLDDGAVQGYGEFDYSKNRGNFYESYDE